MLKTLDFIGPEMQDGSTQATDEVWKEEMDNLKRQNLAQLKFVQQLEDRDSHTMKKLADLIKENTSKNYQIDTQAQDLIFCKEILREREDEIS